MKEGQFEILLLDENNVSFEESEGFILGSPGREYSVCVRINRDNFGKFPFKTPHIKVGLFIDGIDVQYWKRLDLSEIKINDKCPAEVTFWGFKQDTQHVKAFIFALPVSKSVCNTTIKTSTSNEDSLGQVRVVFYEAQVTQEVFQNIIPTSRGAPTEHVISESKKFWQQASLSTTCGRSVQHDSFKPIVRWNNLYKEPSKILVVNYHTPEMFKMMRNFEDAPSSSSSKRVMVDLSNDCDDDKQLLKSQKTKTTEDETNEDIQIMPTIKHVPMLDISGENEEDYVLTDIRIES